jgi:hypothetical protein
MGQNKLREPQRDIEDDRALDAFVNLVGEYSVSVHCALDAYVENKHLFWRIRDVAQAWLFPQPRATIKQTYNVGLVPGMGNITVQVHPQQGNITFIQYYTKLYSEAHKDRHKFFQECFMSQTLADKVSAKMDGLDTRNEKQRIRLLNAEVIGEYMDNVLEVSRIPAEARVEIVYCSVQPFENLSELVHHAFQRVEEFRLQEPAVSWTLCTPVGAEDYYNRICRWMPPLKWEITTLAGKQVLRIKPVSYILIKLISFVFSEG